MKQIQELREEIKAAQEIIDDVTGDPNHPVSDCRHQFHRPSLDALNRLQSQLIDSTVKLDVLLKKSGLKY